LDLEHVIRAFETRDAFFWATHAGAELDLLVLAAGRRYGFEFEYADAPGPTRSMRIAIEDLGLEHLWIIYPGRQHYPVDDRITAWPLSDVRSLPKPRA
jgi:hypothetical protein